MPTFTKWDKLPSELREHSLSYCKTRELGRYAQLSNLCNDEIQKHNNVAPEELSIGDMKNRKNGMMITAKYPSNHYFCLYFVAASENTHKLVRSSSGLLAANQSLENYPILEGNARQAAFKYLEKILRHTTRTEIRGICVDCRKWPNELKRIPAVFKASGWTVVMYQSMYDAFMSFMNEAVNVKNVYLFTNSLDRSIKSLPAHFFKSSFFRQLEYADIALESMISDEDFLSSRAKSLTLNCDTITENAINQKIRNWLESQNDIKFMIKLEEEDRILDKQVILQNLPAQRSNRCFKIQRQDGKIGTIRIHDDGVKFNVD